MVSLSYFSITPPSASITFRSNFLISVEYYNGADGGNGGGLPSPPPQLTTRARMHVLKMLPRHTNIPL